MSNLVSRFARIQEQLVNPVSALNFPADLVPRFKMNPLSEEDKQKIAELWIQGQTAFGADPEGRFRYAFKDSEKNFFIKDGFLAELEYPLSELSPFRRRRTRRGESRRTRTRVMAVTSPARQCAGTTTCR